MIKEEKITIVSVSDIKIKKHFENKTNFTGSHRKGQGCPRQIQSKISQHTGGR